jgi:ADP-ribose pyrophosphatase YjhB (NUDIX family)
MNAGVGYNFKALSGRIVSFYKRRANMVTIGVRAAIFDDNERVFLVKHSYVPGWYLPGGGVEVGEALTTALARELLEEGSIRLLEQPRLFHMYYNRRTSKRDYVALYVVRSFHQDPPQQNREIIAHGYFSPESLPEDTTPSTRARISEVLEVRPPADDW